MSGSVARSFTTLVSASALTLSGLTLPGLMLAGLMLGGLLAGPSAATATADPEHGERAAAGEPALAMTSTQLIARCGDRLGTSAQVTDGSGISTATWGCRRHIYAARTDAAGSWGGAVIIGTGLEPKAVVDRRDRVTVLYRRLHGNGVESRRWAGEAWQPTADLTFRTKARVVFAQWLSIATNARGDTVAVWTQNNGEVQSGPKPRMVATFRPFNGPWTPTVRIADSGVATGGALVDGAGRVVVLPQLYRRTTAGRWRQPTVPAMEGGFAGAAIAPAGDMLVTRMPQAESNAVLVYEKPFGEPWSTGVQVGTTSATLGQARAVLEDGGRAVVSYAAGGSARTVSRPAGGDWAAPVTVSAPHVQASMVRLVSAADGSLALSWMQGSDYVKRELWVSVQPAGGAWSAPVQVTGTDWRHVDHPTMSWESDGSVVVAWTGRQVDLPGWRFASLSVSVT